MIKNKFLFALAAFGATLVASLSIGSGQAFAAVKTWTGNGEDHNWSTAANWNDDTAPVDGDSIVFPIDVVLAGCTSNSQDAITLNNDLDPSVVTFAGLSVVGSHPQDCPMSGFTIEGNTIKSSGDIDLNSYRLAVQIIATSDITIRDVISNGVATAIDIGSNDVTVRDSHFLGRYSQSGIVGDGNLVLHADGGGGGGGGGSCPTQATSSPFGGDSSGFTGSITLTGHTELGLTGSVSSLGTNASSITIDSDNARIAFGLSNNQDATFNLPPITIKSASSINVYQHYSSDCELPANKKATIASPVTINKAVLVYLSQADLHFSGKLTGKEHLSIVEGQSGSISFADGEVLESKEKVKNIETIEDCSQLYIASYKNNKLVLQVDCTKGNHFKYDDPEYPLSVRGVLSGTGKIGHVSIRAGGAIAPGLSPGALTVASITWEEGGIYEFEIGADGHDQIISEGAVVLGDGTLKVIALEGAKAEPGQVFVIIDNKSDDAVDGTFADLPEGATFETSDGGVYKISYVGGDGNDVTLTVVKAPSVPDTGFNLIKNNPVMTLFITMMSATLIAVIARRHKLASSN